MRNFDLNMNPIGLRNRKQVPTILQSESSECGLACVMMVSSHYGYHLSMQEIRQKFVVSQKGMTLMGLIKVANLLNLNARPLKVGVDTLGALRNPCILHWSLNHFVVLVEVKKSAIKIIDPALGEREIGYEEVKENFTGFALELWPNPGFQKKPPPERIKLSTILGNVQGTFSSIGKIIILALALELCSLMAPQATQWIVDQVVPSRDQELLITLIIGFSGLFIFQELVRYARSSLLLILSGRFNLQFRANVFAHFLRLPVFFYSKRSMGDLVSRFASIDSIQRILTTSFVEVALDGVMSVATCALMMMYSPLLASISIIASVLYLCGRGIWHRKLHRNTEEQIISASHQQSHFLETLRGIRAIKLFEKIDHRHARWMNLLSRQINADMQAQHAHLVYRTGNALLFAFENLAILYFGALSVIEQQMSIGVLIAFLAYKNQFGTRATSLMDKFFDYKLMNVQTERLSDIVLTEAEPAAYLNEVREGVKKVGLELSNITFSYGANEKPVMEGLNLLVKPGEYVAIIGPSGCGKSTLAQLVLGIYIPQTGAVDVIEDGKRLEVGASKRAYIGAVMQDDTLFAGSIAENISFFDSQIDMKWVEKCAEMAAIYEDICAMPAGFQTQVGDMGSILSGGQKQRVLIARALYKKPSILILDEATSHLDVEAELKVNKAIGELDVTRLIISHRPETIQLADRIVSFAQLVNKGE